MIHNVPKRSNLRCPILAHHAKCNFLANWQQKEDLESSMGVHNTKKKNTENARKMGDIFFFFYPVKCIEKVFSQFSLLIRHVVRCAKPRARCCRVFHYTRISQLNCKQKWPGSRISVLGIDYLCSVPSTLVFLGLKRLCGRMAPRVHGAACLRRWWAKLRGRWRRDHHRCAARRPGLAFG